MLYLVCVMSFIEGRLDNGDIIKGAIRSCSTRKFFLPEFEDDKCEDKNSTELGALIGIDLPESENLNGSFCVCSNDQCNGEIYEGIDDGDSSSMIKVTMVTQSLMVIALGVFSSKTFGFLLN